MDNELDAGNDWHNANHNMLCVNFLFVIDFVLGIIKIEIQ